MTSVKLSVTIHYLTINVTLVIKIYRLAIHIAFLEIGTVLSNLCPTFFTEA